MSKKVVYAVPASGWTASRIRAQLNAHRWQRIGSAIIRHNGDPSPGELRHVALAVQGPRALLTAFTGLHEDGLTGWERGEIHLLVPCGARVVRPPELSLRIHYTGRWDLVEQTHARRPCSPQPSATTRDTAADCWIVLDQLTPAPCVAEGKACSARSSCTSGAARPSCTGISSGRGCQAREDGLMPLNTDLTVSADPALLDVERIARWLAGSYWAHDRERDTVERSLAGSLVWGAYADGGQVGLTRAVTDRATFAWLCDVVVDEAWRGRGVGHRMVGVAVEELRALGVPRIVLTTRDAHRVYADLGFSALRVPATWMEIDTRATRPDPQDVRR